MKKTNKLEINSEKLMKNEELLALKGGGGDSLYRCYREGWGGMPCNGFITSFNTAGCNMALQICIAFGGGCVTGPGC